MTHTYIHTHIHVHMHTCIHCICNQTYTHIYSFNGKEVSIHSRHDSDQSADTGPGFFPKVRQSVAVGCCERESVCYMYFSNSMGVHMCVCTPHERDTTSV